MSKSVSNVFQTTFDAMVKQAYQGGEKLKGTYRVKNGVIGKEAKFRKVGKGMASKRIPQTDVVPLNVNWDDVTAIIEDWDASEYTAVEDINKINFDEKQELADLIAEAMGRRSDQIALDALQAATENVLVEPGFATGFIVRKLLDIKEIMDDNGVPEGDRHIAVSATNMRQLLNTTEATSSDYNSIQALVKGTLDTFVGFKFHMIESRDEGGLAKSGNIRDVLAWHKTAVGVGIGSEIKTDTNWIPEKKSWLTTSDYSAGGVAIDQKGIVKLRVDESVATS